MNVLYVYPWEHFTGVEQSGVRWLEKNGKGSRKVQGLLGSVNNMCEGLTRCGKRKDVKQGGLTLLKGYKCPTREKNGKMGFIESGS